MDDLYVDTPPLSHNFSLSEKLSVNGDFMEG